MKDREERDERKQKADSMPPSDSKSAGAQSITVPVIEEKITIGKEIQETGRIRVQKKVHETEEIFELPVNKEEMDVERVPVNQYVDTAPPAIRHEGDTTIIPVLQEVTVVEKRLLLVEEVRITKRMVRTENSQRVSLRKEEVIVSREKKEKKNEV